MPRVDLLPPLFTPTLPGTGGQIKTKVEDFVVEEIPAYEPSGEGDHCYLWIEKTGIDSEHFMKLIANKVGVPYGSVGSAGLKDRHAITRQWVSVPKEAEPRLAKIDGNGIKLIKVSRHANKLKPGHLRGNKFEILIRNADQNQSETVSQILKKITTEGMPNYYGPQRFGRGGETAELGFRCITGQVKQRLRPFLFKFAISAAQSVLFNRVLGQRFLDGLMRTVLPGDVMMKWPFGGIFVAEDIPTEQNRFDLRETVHAGPMFGSKTFAAKEVAAQREEKIFAESGLFANTFHKLGKLAAGTRRHNLIYIDDLTHDWKPDGLWLKFSLPPGSYATVLLREVMKVDLTEKAFEEGEREAEETD